MDHHCDGLTPNIGELSDALYDAREWIAELRARGALPGDDDLDAMYETAHTALDAAFGRGLGAAKAAEQRIEALYEALGQLDEADRWAHVLRDGVGVPDDHADMVKATQARDRAQVKATRAYGRMTTPARPSRSYTTAPQPRRAPLRRPGHARRPRAHAMRSSAASGDSPDDDLEPSPERAGRPLRLWRHPQWGNVSPNLLRALVAAERASR